MPPDPPVYSHLLDAKSYFSRTNSEVFPPGLNYWKSVPLLEKLVTVRIAKGSPCIVFLTSTYSNTALFSTAHLSAHSNKDHSKRTFQRES